MRAAVIVALIAAAQAKPAAKGDAARDASRIVARIGDLAITAETFASFVLDERATTQQGSEALEVLVQERVVEVEAARRGLSVDAAAVTARMAELDKKMREQTGGKTGLADYLAATRHMTEAEFRAKLPTAMLAERMMHEDFGLAAAELVPAEKQGLWFRDGHRPEVKRDGLPAGVAASVGGKEVRRSDWGITLFGALADQDEENLFKDFVGAQLLLKRGRELDIKVTAEEIQKEVDERSALLREVLAKQGMPTDGVDWLSTIKSRGDDPAVVLNSDKFKAEIILKELTRRLHGKDGFKGYYEARRADFDALFGRKVQLATIFLIAAPKKSAKVTRTWAEATHELDLLKDRLSGDPGALAAAFASQARIHSEEARSARSGGDLGFLGLKELGERGLPTSLLDEKAGTLYGPLNTAGGVHLLLVGEKKDASPFEEIRAEVEKAARRNVLEDLQKDVKIERNL
jgi:parvulin-like peptidyl-prolyl isomerase